MPAIRVWDHDPTCPLCLLHWTPSPTSVRIVLSLRQFARFCNLGMSTTPGLNLTIVLPSLNGGMRSFKGRSRRSCDVSMDNCFMLYGTPGKKGICAFFTAKRLTSVDVASIAGRWEDILQREHAFTPYLPAIPTLARGGNCKSLGTLLQHTRRQSVVRK
jgi:hypothetical protein